VKNFHLNKCSIVTALLLIGCSSFIAKPYEERVTQVAVVTWLTLDNAEEECIKAGVKDPGPLGVIFGCAIYNKKSCKILTSKTTSMEILGHELRHCFEGKFHQ
jgi:hypothetical protein